MNQNDRNSGGASAPVIVEDLFLTDAFLIKGRLPNKTKRLSNVLEDWTKTFLTVEDATMISLRNGEVIRTPSVQVNQKEVICAHELLDFAGDHAMRRLAQPNKAVRIRAFYAGAVQFELTGNVEPGAYEQSMSNRKYFIMQTPILRGLDLSPPELQSLGTLEYAIVRKDKLAYVYDFRG
jgi:hypothetical protein